MTRACYTAYTDIYMVLYGCFALHDLAILRLASPRDAIARSPAFYLALLLLALHACFSLACLARLHCTCLILHASLALACLAHLHCTSLPCTCLHCTCLLCTWLPCTCAYLVLASPCSPAYLYRCLITCSHFRHLPKANGCNCACLSEERTVQLGDASIGQVCGEHA
jgi:hypothetical protein